MKTRRLRDLDVAIKMGRTVGLYEAELELAWRTLDMARKTTAWASIREAQLEDHVGKLTAALRHAATVGITEAELATDQADLMARELKSKARKTIARAELRDLGEELDFALAEGEYARLQDPDMEGARGMLRVHEKRMAARDAIDKAMGGKFSTMNLLVPEKETKLLSTLSEGLDVGLLEQEHVVKRGRMELDAEKQKNAARRRIKDAMLRKQHRQEEQLVELRAAIKDGRALGLDPEDLEWPEIVLGKEERDFAARAAITKASERFILGELQAALRQGEAAELEIEILEKTRRLIEDARKPAARLVIKDAILGRDIERLKEAIKLGESVGLTGFALKEATETLELEKRRVVARERLAALGEKPKANELRNAVNFARGVDLGAEEMRSFLAMLAAEDRKIASRKELQRAAESRSVAKLRAALSEADEAGLAPLEMLVATQVLDDVLQIGARLKLDELHARGPKVDLEAYEQAIEYGVEVKLSKEELKPHKKLLKEEQRKAKAREQVAEALTDRGLEKLRAAAKEGEAAGLIMELRDLRSALDLEERRAAARVRLTAALASEKSIGKAELVRDAIAKAKTARLPKDELQEPYRVLKEEEAKDEAREAMAEARASRRVRDLQLAIIAGDRASLEDSEFSSTEAVLKVERRKAAVAAMQEAKKDPTVKKTWKAVELAEEAAFPETVLAPLRDALARAKLQSGMANLTITELRVAVEYGEERIPEDPLLEEAKRTLAVEDRKHVARGQLRAAEHGGRADEISAALTEAEEAGLQQWELEHAGQALARARHDIVLQRVVALRNSPFDDD